MEEIITEAIHLAPFPWNILIAIAAAVLVVALRKVWRGLPRLPPEVKEAPQSPPLHSDPDGSFRLNQKPPSDYT